MTHHRRHDCVHDCERCDLADPALCSDWAEMTAEHHTIRYCKQCGARAWHYVERVTDGAGNVTETNEWRCPSPDCGRVWGVTR